MNNKNFNELKNIGEYPRQRIVWILIQSLSLCDKQDVEIETMEHQGRTYYFLIDVFGLLGLADSERSNIQRMASKLIKDKYLDTVIYDMNGEWVEPGTANPKTKKYVRLSKNLESVFNL